MNSLRGCVQSIKCAVPTQLNEMTLHYIYTHKTGHIKRRIEVFKGKDNTLRAEMCVPALMGSMIMTVLAFNCDNENRHIVFNTFLS